MRKLAGIILVIIGLTALASNSSALGENAIDYEKKWTFASGELHQLLLKSDYAVNVKFEKSTNGTNSVYLKGQGSQSMVDAVSGTALSSGKLDVQLVDKRKWHFDLFHFGSHREVQQMIVTLAEGAELETLGLQLDSSSLSVSDAQVKNADFSVGSGSLTIENLTAERFKMQADSGSVKAVGIHADTEIHADSGSLRLEQVTGPTRLTMDSGSVRLYKDDTSPTDVKADSGSVYVHMPSSFAGFYDLQADSGSIRAPESKRKTTDVVKIRADSGSIIVEQD